MQLIHDMPATLLSWLVVMAHTVAGLGAGWWAFLVTFAVCGASIGVSTVRKHRPEPVDPRSVGTARVDPAESFDNYLRALRIAADDETLTGSGFLTTGYDPAIGRVKLDDRTAQLVVDPTLRAAEVAEMVDHVAPGAGSVVSVATATADTAMRTTSELDELHTAELDAYAEAERLADVAFFARFDRIMDVELAGFRERTARVETWLHYLHGETDHCPVCAAAMAEVSAEHRQIVGKEDTGAYDLEELRNLLNPVARLVNA